MNNFVITSINEYFHNKKYDKLIQLAKNYDYNTFLSKTDNLTSFYNILYRGMYDGDELSDKSFMTDYVGHAKEYGDYVDGIIVGDHQDILYIDDDIFNNLRDELKNVDRKKLYNIYEYYFTNNKLFDAMVDDDENSVIDFVYNFIKKSKVPYSKVQKNKIKNDLLIPIMLYYAESKGKNIISFLGGDYGDYGGADEFVVNDISKYIKLSTIYKNSIK